LNYRTSFGEPDFDDGWSGHTKLSGLAIQGCDHPEYSLGFRGIQHCGNVDILIKLLFKTFSFQMRERRTEISRIASLPCRIR